MGGYIFFLSSRITGGSAVQMSRLLFFYSVAIPFRDDSDESLFKTLASMTILILCGYHSVG